MIKFQFRITSSKGDKFKKLNTLPLTIGSSKDNLIRVKKILPHHCIVYINQGQVIVNSVDKEAVCFVNAKAITAGCPVTLSIGDKLSFKDCDNMFILEELKDLTPRKSSGLISPKLDVEEKKKESVVQDKVDLKSDSKIIGSVKSPKQSEKSGKSGDTKIETKGTEQLKTQRKKKIETSIAKETTLPVSNSETTSRKENTRSLESNSTVERNIVPLDRQCSMSLLDEESIEVSTIQHNVESAKKRKRSDQSDNILNLESSPIKLKKTDIPKQKVLDVPPFVYDEERNNIVQNCLNSFKLEDEETVSYGSLDPHLTQVQLPQDQNDQANSSYDLYESQDSTDNPQSIDNQKIVNICDDKETGRKTLESSAEIKMQTRKTPIILSYSSSSSDIKEHHTRIKTKRNTPKTAHKVSDSSSSREQKNKRSKSLNVRKKLQHCSSSESEEEEFEKECRLVPQLKGDHWRLVQSRDPVNKSNIKKLRKQMSTHKTKRKSSRPERYGSYI